MAQAFDPATGTLSGEPQSLAKGVMNDISTWHMDASASNDGLLVFGSGGSGDLQLVWMDRNGKQISTIADKLPNLQAARISPAGRPRRAADGRRRNDIWVLDLARGVRTRLTFGPVANLNPVWSPDGKWIAYVFDRNGHFDLYRKPSDGSGAEELLFTDDRRSFPAIGRATASTCSIRAAFREAPRKSGRCRWKESASRRCVLPHGSGARLFPRTAIGWPTVRSNPARPKSMWWPLAAGQGKWQVSANGGRHAAVEHGRQRTLLPGLRRTAFSRCR